VVAARLSAVFATYCGRSALNATLNWIVGAQHKEYLQQTHCWSHQCMYVSIQVCDGSLRSIAWRLQAALWQPSQLGQLGSRWNVPASVTAAHFDQGCVRFSSPLCRQMARQCRGSGLCPAPSLTRPPIGGCKPAQRSPLFVGSKPIGEVEDYARPVGKRALSLVLVRVVSALQARMLWHAQHDEQSRPPPYRLAGGERP
jgi:hypothetical protein